MLSGIFFCLEFTFLISTSSWGMNLALACFNKETIQPVQYNPGSSLCCHGRLHQYRDFNFTIGCCSLITKEEVIYNRQNQTCCGGALYNTHAMKVMGMGCCKASNTVYRLDGDTTICCKGVLHTNIRRDMETCCGNITYNIVEKRCCKEKIYQRNQDEGCCGSRTYNIHTHECVDKKVTEVNIRYCDTTKINITHQVCCSGTIYNIGIDVDRMRCCGKNLFHIEKEACDNRHVVNRGNKWCDDGGEYNPHLRICCGGNLHYNSYGQDAVCCGKHLIDTRTTQCCGRKHQQYDTVTHQCCGDALLHRSLTCCGRKPMDTAKYVCCPQTFDNPEHSVRKEQINHTDCCPSDNGGTSYSKLDSYCSHENTVESLSNIVAKCGYDPYNKTTDLCCGYQLYPYEKMNGNQCCYPGASIYNPETHSCCDGIPKRGRSCIACRGSCCKVNASVFIRRTKCRSLVYVVRARDRSKKMIIKSINQQKKTSKIIRCKLFRRKSKLIMLETKRSKKLFTKYNKRIIREIKRKFKIRCGQR